MVSVSKQSLKILRSSVKPEETTIYRVQEKIYVNPLKPVNLINIIPHYQATSLAFTINLINVLKIKRSFGMDASSKTYFKDVVIWRSQENGTIIGGENRALSQWQWNEKWIIKTELKLEFWAIAGGFGEGVMLSFQALTSFTRSLREPKQHASDSSGPCHCEIEVSECPRSGWPWALWRFLRGTEKKKKKEKEIDLPMHLPNQEVQIEDRAGHLSWPS